MDMRLDVCKLLECQSRIYCLEYSESTLNCRVFNRFLYHGFVLDYYIMLWCVDKSLTVALLMLDLFFYEDDF